LDKIEIKKEKKGIGTVLIIMPAIFTDLFMVNIIFIKLRLKELSRERKGREKL